jgi:hypothetical protein
MESNKNIYPITNFKPLVIESYNKQFEFENVIYKRRLRINGFNLSLLDEYLKTDMYHTKLKTIVLDCKDTLKQICEFLQIEFKPNVNTYLYIDSEMCSFKSL